MLIEQGLEVTIAARGRDRLEAAAQQIGAMPRVTDVTDPSACQDLLDWHVERTRRLDILINSAGISQVSRLDSMSQTAWDEVLEVNLLGVLNMIKAALPALRQSQGLMVSLSSLAASGRTPGLGAYSAAKAGVITLMRTLESENREHGLRATALSPGFVDTPMASDATRPEAEMIRPEDCAACVRLLLELSPGAHISEISISNRPLSQ
jgi:NADP-dependent 3-hydroxy acid dehydrogenase YdfG